MYNNKRKNSNIMTCEEIRQEMDNLSHELYVLGTHCTDKMGDPILMLAGEFIKNTTFTLDSFITQLEMAGNK